MNASPGCHILDAGCGTGHHTKRLCDKGITCTAVDISDVALSKAAQLEPRAAYLQRSLHALSLPDKTFDGIHCRGVLMHVPLMDESIAELVRVLKPGGKIAILENNCAALEMKLILAVRKVRKGESEMRSTPAGLEFWSQENGHPFLVRYSHVSHITSQLEKNGVTVTAVESFEMFDLARFPGFLRVAITFMNKLALRWRVPPRFCHGVIVVGSKPA